MKNFGKRQFGKLLPFLKNWISGKRFIEPQSKENLPMVQTIMWLHFYFGKTYFLFKGGKKPGWKFILSLFIRVSTWGNLQG